MKTNYQNTSRNALISKLLSGFALIIFAMAFFVPSTAIARGPANCPDCIPEPGDPGPDPEVYAYEAQGAVVPDIMLVGQTYSVTVRIANGGTRTWTSAEGFRLASINPDNNMTWGRNRVELSGPVAGGTFATFTFNVTAPTTPGVYNFHWIMTLGDAFFPEATTNKAITVVGSNIIGYVDGLMSNDTQLAGWACSTRLDPSINVQLYLGGPAGVGTLYGTYPANINSEPAVAQSCMNAGSAYRYLIPITTAMRTDFGGQTIYVHGVSSGQPNNLLTNSGNFWVPPLTNGMPTQPVANATTLVSTRTYVYDNAERLCKRIEPETGATIMDYDAAGNLLWSAQGSGLTSNACDRGSVPASEKTVRTYNNMNRLIYTDVPASTNDLTYSYYADGALQTLINGTNRWDYTYNKLRLPVTETLTIDSRIKTLTHAYNSLAQETSLAYPSGLVVASSPNALGQATQAGTFATGISYFANGGMSAFTYGNGIVHSLMQNVRLLPLRSKDMNGSTAILDDTYTFDANANVTSIVDGTTSHGGNRSMLYDTANRLTKTTAPNQAWINNILSYDVLDNIRVNTLGARTYSYQYNATTQRLDQLTLPNASVARALTYDTAGNVTTNGTQSYVFDKANRMEAVTSKENYEYDGHGRRVKVIKYVGKLTDYPIYSLEGKLITEDDSRNGKTIDYVYLNGSLVAKRSAPLGNATYTTTYLHTDSLGSPVAESNAAKTVTRIERYTPYGEPTDQGYDQGPGFTGHVTDAATGLSYAQQRYYDPMLGRFLSPDPMQADPNSGASFNRFAYAENNPYRYTDPDGRMVAYTFIRFVLLPLLMPRPVENQPNAVPSPLERDRQDSGNRSGGRGDGTREGRGRGDGRGDGIRRGRDGEPITQESRGKNRIPDKGEPGTIQQNPPGTTGKEYGSDGWVETEWNNGHGPGYPENEQDDHVHDHEPNPYHPEGRPTRGAGRPPTPAETERLKPKPKS